MIVTPKKNGEPRRTVDLQQLNKATLREVHHTPSPFNMVASTPTGKRKTVLDAWNGYHSLPLNTLSRDATTFITEWGRYRYCRAPMGFHASGDAYTRRFDDITARQPRTVRCVDDSLLWNDTIEESFWHTLQGKNIVNPNLTDVNQDTHIEYFEDVDTVLRQLDDNDLIDEIKACPYFSISDLNSLKPKGSIKSFFHLNINSLNLHQDELQLLLENCDTKFDFIGITETGPQKNSNQSLKLDKYQHEDCFTESRKGGTRI